MRIVTDDATALADAVRGGRATAVGVARDALSAARDSASLGAFWSLDSDGARCAASALDRARTRGEEMGLLAGVPVAVKDNVDVRGLPTTGGLGGPHRPARGDAEAVRRLRRAGAIPLGKTAMDPLGWSTLGEAPGHLPCLNPRDRSLSPGGSSAGSAATVAAGIAPLGIGTDTAGSVRIPAAHCGIVGLRPALRAIPRRGVLVVTPSFEVPGLLARSVRDCRRAYETLTGRPIGAVPDRLRIALLEDLLDEAEPPVAEACERATRALGRAGAGAPRIAIHGARIGWRAPGFGRILAVELARTWGRRIDSEPERFPAAIRASAEHGRRTRAADYERARREIMRARRRIGARVREFDALVCPTLPTSVPSRGEQRVDVSIEFTRRLSALGWHAISVPAGRDPSGRPVGVQLGAPRAKLGRLLAVAAAIEAVGAASQSAG